jgi:hypothetical protein
VLRPGLAASPAAVRHGGAAGRSCRHRASPAFHDVLAAAISHGARGLGSTNSGAAVQTAMLNAPRTLSHATASEPPVSTIPAHAEVALQQAMRPEGVPESWQPGLRFIMARESSGTVDARSPVHSARGLFQLTAANYHLNPNGAGSFGNAIEEAQGGIRYIQQRYGTADNAVAFWQQHGWY